MLKGWEAKGGQTPEAHHELFWDSQRTQINRRRLFGLEAANSGSNAKQVLHSAEKRFVQDDNSLVRRSVRKSWASGKLSPTCLREQPQILPLRCAQRQNDNVLEWRNA